jgi:hypothetical protein
LLLFLNLLIAVTKYPTEQLKGERSIHLGREVVVEPSNSHHGGQEAESASVCPTWLPPLSPFIPSRASAYAMVLSASRAALPPPNPQLILSGTSLMDTPRGVLY